MYLGWFTKTLIEDTKLVSNYVKRGQQIAIVQIDTHDATEEPTWVGIVDHVFHMEVSVTMSLVQIQFIYGFFHSFVWWQVLIFLHPDFLISVDKIDEINQPPFYNGTFKYTSYKRNVPMQFIFHWALMSDSYFSTANDCMVKCRTCNPRI